MIENGADVDEIEIMRSMLDYEGWHINELLPEGWRLKLSKNNLRIAMFQSSRKRGADAGISSSGSISPPKRRQYHKGRGVISK